MQFQVNKEPVLLIRLVYKGILLRGEQRVMIFEMNVYKFTDLRG